MIKVIKTWTSLYEIKHIANNRPMFEVGLYMLELFLEGNKQAFKGRVYVPAKVFR